MTSNKGAQGYKTFFILNSAEHECMSKVKVIKCHWLKFCQTEYNSFSPETAWPTEVIFHVEAAQNRSMKL